MENPAIVVCSSKPVDATVIANPTLVQLARDQPDKRIVVDSTHGTDKEKSIYVTVFAVQRFDGRFFTPVLCKQPPMRDAVLCRRANDVTYVAPARSTRDAVRRCVLRSVSSDDPVSFFQNESQDLRIARRAAHSSVTT